MIQLKNASFCYEGAAENSLNDVDLEIEQGECVVLTGPSGCGKTTITRLLNGLIPHFYSGECSGEIKINGRNACECKPHELSCFVGSVFQNPRTQFFNTDTTSELVFSMENMGISRDSMAMRLEKTLADLELRSLVDQDIFALSGGEQQRIAFGSVYALSPEVYVLDEPTANLDAAAIEHLRVALLHVKRQGKTIVIAEHRLHYLDGIADRIVSIDKGEISSQWTASCFSQMDNSVLAKQGLRPSKLTDVKTSDRDYTDVRAAIELKGLTSCYDRSPVFTSFNFTAGQGEIVGIIAPNGTGKTTLARTICGLHRETSGQVLFGGKSIKPRKRSKHAYLVMQDPNYQLFSDSVEGELQLSRGGSPPEGEVDEILDNLGLSPFRQRHPLSLSGGQKQRLAVALAALSPADVLIFDEPTSGLDLASMHSVVEMLNLLAKRGKTLLVITHDNEFLSLGCHRVIRLSKRQAD